MSEPPASLYVSAKPYDWEKPHPVVAVGEDCPECCCRGPKFCPECKLRTAHQDVEDEVQIGDDDWEWTHSYRCQNCGWYLESGVG